MFARNRKILLKLANRRKRINVGGRSTAILTNEILLFLAAK